MKTRILSTLTLLAAFLATNAQVLDASSESFLASEEILNNNSARRATATTVSYTPMIVKLANESGYNEIKNTYSSVILDRRDDLVLACVPTKNLAKLNASSNLVTASIATPTCATMNVAREAANVDNVISGLGLDKAYTGKGVVVGFCDTGFDPGHIAFRDSNGDSRIARYVHINELRGEVSRYDGNDALTATTDKTAQYHATHVAGILAGSDCGNGLHGVASEATIVATTSNLYNVGILKGVAEVVDYAQSVGLPAVVNISLASYIGPHDGTTLFNQYLAKLGEEAIICVSSGNNGNTCTTLHKTFSSSEDYIRSSLLGGNRFNPAGTVDIWASDSQPVEISFGVWDRDTNSLVNEFTDFIGGAGKMSYQIATTNYFSSSYTTRVRWEPFTNGFVGYIGVKAETNKHNNRYHISLSFNYTSSTPSAANASMPRYMIVFAVRGQQGQRADLFSDGGTAFYAAGPSGSVYGDASMSVNDLACGENVICVGQLDTRSGYPFADGSNATLNTTAGNAASTSSYATLLDGRVLPHVIAPGQIVSAYSNAHKAAYPASVKASASVTDANGTTYDWVYMAGTSMSSPFVAGSIALLLEAAPSLTVNDVLSYFQTTSGSSSAARVISSEPRRAEGSNPRFGSFGTINVYDLMYTLLDDNGVDLAAYSAQSDDNSNQGPVTGLDALSSSDRASIAISADGIVSISGKSNVAATVYSVDGKALRTASASGEALALDCSQLPAGVYIVDVMDSGSRYSEKIALR